MPKRRERAGPLEYSRKLWLRAWLAATFLFLYAPIVILILFSFNDSKRNIVWQGFTLGYYHKAIGNASLIEAFTNSLTIGLISTAVSTVVGALLALALWRFRFPGKPALEGALALPIVIPEICMGVALMAFFIRTGWPTQLPWPLNLGPIIIGHIAFSFPFVAIVVRARMAGFDRALEEASKDLGAGEWQTFCNITLPYMKPGLIAGGAARDDPVARRLRHHLLHLGPGDPDLPDQGLFDGPLRRDARGQRRLDRADRDDRAADGRRHAAAAAGAGRGAAGMNRSADRPGRGGAPSASARSSRSTT